jgi:hypothetical protein
MRVPRFKSPTSHNVAFIMRPAKRNRAARFVLRAKGAKCNSPGQRPGKKGTQHKQALKGRKDRRALNMMRAYPAAMAGTVSDTSRTMLSPMLTDTVPVSAAAVNTS